MDPYQPLALVVLLATAALVAQLGSLAAAKLRRRAPLFDATSIGSAAFAAVAVAGVETFFVVQHWERQGDWSREAQQIEGVLFRAREEFRADHGRDPADLESMGIVFRKPSRRLEVGYKSTEPSWEGENFLAYSGEGIAIDGSRGAQPPVGICARVDGPCVVASGRVGGGIVAWRLDGKTREPDQVVRVPALVSTSGWIRGSLILVGAVAVAVAIDRGMRRARENHRA